MFPLLVNAAVACVLASRRDFASPMANAFVDRWDTFVWLFLVPQCPSLAAQYPSPGIIGRFSDRQKALISTPYICSFFWLSLTPRVKGLMWRIGDWEASGVAGCWPQPRTFALRQRQKMAGGEGYWPRKLCNTEDQAALVST